jgi:uncharacterized protein with NAD-binding domain and iron-sulfur cluster
MVQHVATVPTQSLQVWLRPSDHELGWAHPGSTVAGYAEPFDTYASMSHLIGREAWPDGRRPGSIAYFCSVLPASTATDPAVAREVVRQHAEQFLERHAAHFWPAARAENGQFRWELLCGAGTTVGPPRLNAQYWRANVDPSDRYVQSLPGTGRLRLRADESGYRNLVLAGDWINCGLNAGCIEAAVMAGLQAGNVLRGRLLTSGLLGSWYGLPSE